MKHKLTLIFLLLATISYSQEKIEWLTWDEAVKRSETDSVPKKIFIDLYTDWCGWCKRMDQVTFANPEVAAYMNQHFYNVKFDAEQKDSIVYEGNVFKNSNPTAKKREGVHLLAYSLMDGELSYPTYVVLDENRARITYIKGFKTVPDFMATITFFATNQHVQYMQYLEKQYQKRQTQK
ncbi:MAG: thioredoxin family protein [Bacteroidia bacterium]